MRSVCARGKIKPRTSKYESKKILGTKNNEDKGRKCVVWLELWEFVEGLGFED